VDAEEQGDAAPAPSQPPPAAEASAAAEVAESTAPPVRHWPPPGELSSHAGRVEAAFLGALAGERAAQAPAAAGDLLEVAASIAGVGGFDAEDLRRRGLTGSSQAGPAGLLLRAVPFGLLSPWDRPRIRRDAYRVAALAGADEATAVAAVAAALLAADLTRFDPVTAAVRVRQSLLEDAPMALLDRLRTGPAELPEHDDDPGAALQLAVAAMGSADQVEAAVRAATAPGRRAAVSLAGALAGAHLGSAGIDDALRSSLPHGQRAVELAAAVASVAGGAAGPGSPSEPPAPQPA